MQEDNDTTDLGNIPSAPKLSKKSLKSKRKAISSAEHAWEICKRLIKDNEDRIAEYAEIRAQADGIEPPYDNSKLEEQGKNYKSNINTGFLGTVHNKVFPRMSGRVKSARYLTASSLPAVTDMGEPIDRYKEKTEIFRQELTKTVRQWKRFHSFINGLASTTSLYGLAYVAYTDPLEWRPSVFRPDEAFIPNGTSQLDEELPLFMIKDEYYIHELFELIEDKEIAKDAGYDIDAVIEAINEAKPRDVDEESENETYLEYEDIRRELVNSTSFSEGSRVIKVYHLFATEHDGTVSQYMIDADTEQFLFESENLYEAIDDVVTPIPFQFGNGKYHGSYGVGQMLYDIALRVEKNRNAVIDNEVARGKFNIVVNDEKEMAEAKLHITDEANYLSGATFAGNQAALPSTADAFLELDRAIVGMAEEKVGAFMPEPLIPGSSKTATEANINAAKEQETREAIIDHWLSHFALAMRNIARRLVNPDNEDYQATALRVALLGQGLNEEEIQLLALQYPTQTVADFAETREQRIIGFLSARKGDPIYNQLKLEKSIATAAIGAELANDLIIAEDDNTIQIEAARQQEEENTSMQAGKNIPVSPRDAHNIHMQVLKGQVDPQSGQSTSAMIQALQAGDVNTAKNMLGHYNQHVQIAVQQGKLGEQMNEEKQFMAQVENQIKQIESQIMKAQQEQAMAQQQQAEIEQAVAQGLV